MQGEAIAPSPPCSHCLYSTCGRIHSPFSCRFSFPSPSLSRYVPNCSSRYSPSLAPPLLAPPPAHSGARGHLRGEISALTCKYTHLKPSQRWQAHPECLTSLWWFCGILGVGLFHQTNYFTVLYTVEGSTFAM